MTRLLMIYSVLLDKDGDGSGAGGGSAISRAGGENQGGNQGDDGGISPNKGNTGDKGGDSQDPEPIKLHEKWLQTLPEEIREEPCLQHIKDMDSLVKSYVHAQKAVGGDKVPVPGPNATEDDWKQVYKKLGMPETPDEYKLDVGDSFKDEKFLNGFKEKCMELGVLPKQAQDLLPWFKEQSDKSQEAMDEKLNELRKENLEELKSEWGRDFDRRLKRANLALKELAGEDFEGLLEELDATGLGDHPGLLKSLYKVSEFLSEDTFVDGKFSSKTFGSLTPAQAQEKANEILGDSQHPYWSKAHPGHDKAVKEVTELFEIAGQQTGA